MKVKLARISKENRGAPAQPPFQQSLSPDAARETIMKVVRRQGFLLSSIHAVCMEELLKHDLKDEALYFNDSVKPLADQMIHFDWEPVAPDTEVDDGEV